MDSVRSHRTRRAGADLAAAGLLTAVAVLFIAGSFTTLVDYGDLNPQAPAARIQWRAWEFVYNLPPDRASYRQLIGIVPTVGAVVSVLAAALLTVFGSNHRRARAFAVAAVALAVSVSITMVLAVISARMTDTQDMVEQSRFGSGFWVFAVSAAVSLAAALTLGSTTNTTPPPREHRTGLVSVLAALLPILSILLAASAFVLIVEHHGWLDWWFGPYTRLLGLPLALAATLPPLASVFLLDARIPQGRTLASTAAAIGCAPTTLMVAHILGQGMPGPAEPTEFGPSLWILAATIVLTLATLALAVLSTPAPPKNNKGPTSPPGPGPE